MYKRETGTNYSREKKYFSYTSFQSACNYRANSVSCKEVHRCLFPQCSFHVFPGNIFHCMNGVANTKGIVVFVCFCTLLCQRTLHLLAKGCHTIILSTFRMPCIRRPKFLWAHICIWSFYPLVILSA